MVIDEKVDVQSSEIVDSQPTVDEEAIQAQYAKDEEEALCTTCKHCQKDFGRDLCMRPNRQTRQPLTATIGEHDAAIHRQRAWPFPFDILAGKCGTRGRFWEPRKRVLAPIDLSLKMDGTLEVAKLQEFVDFYARKYPRVLGEVVDIAVGKLNLADRQHFIFAIKGIAEAIRPRMQTLRENDANVSSCVETASHAVSSLVSTVTDYPSARENYELKKRHKKAMDAFRKEMDALTNTNRKLERQKRELMQKLAKARGEEVEDAEVVSMDPSSICDLLVLVGVRVGVSDVTRWSNTKRKEAITWAGAYYAGASDNEGVVVPPKPAFLEEYVTVR